MEIIIDIIEFFIGVLMVFGVGWIIGQILKLDRYFKKN